MENLIQTMVPVRNALDVVQEKDVTRMVSCKSKGGISEKMKGGMTFTITDL
jgi:purine nucleoside phosphorylase